ncbi:MAG: signal recognition particle protein [Erysipelotrichaceae bacterium]|nr:signal recognition particle protein [Erysipelotrichaceae bacterium]
MAFENLGNKITKAFKHIQGKDKLSENNMESMLKEIRLALLEADVNYSVVKKLLAEIKEEAIGQQVYTAVEPGQMVVKIVHDKLVDLLGSGDTSLNIKTNGLTTIMMVGLQGGGKTTSVAKIANLLTKQGKKVLMVACDLIRPAAIDQLKTLGKQCEIEVFERGVSLSAVELVKQAKQYALANQFDVMIVDTAGRLHIDEALMEELSQIKKTITPDEILLVVDAMSGQDIIHVAKSFHELLSVTGLVVTKMDGDSRGGSVLSVKSITSVPVKFIGEGEKISDMSIFYPERLADRILGMGDVLTLVEKAQENMDEEESMKLMQKMMNGTFDLEDMLKQMKMMKKLGPLSGIMKMIPGMSAFSQLEQLDDDKTDKTMKRTEAIILSMTKKERKDPSILRASHKNRIAKGSGTSVNEVNQVINNFKKQKEMMTMLTRMSQGGGMPSMPDMSALQNPKKQQKMSKGQIPSFMRGKRW